MTASAALNLKNLLHLRRRQFPSSSISKEERAVRRIQENYHQLRRLKRNTLPVRNWNRNKLRKWQGESEIQKELEAAHLALNYHNKYTFIHLKIIDLESPIPLHYTPAMDTSLQSYL